MFPVRVQQASRHGEAVHESALPELRPAAGAGDRMTRWRDGIYPCTAGGEWDEHNNRWRPIGEHTHYSNLAYELCNRPPKYILDMQDR